MARKKMSDDDLISNIELLERQAQSMFSGEIAREQSTAMDFYLSAPMGTEEEGRSAVISSDVWDVVEGLTPNVLKPFVSSDDIMRFTPEGAEDEEAAEQESDYVNYVVTQKNDAFEQLVACVKTGLLQKNGVFKWWWEKTTRKSIERYEGLSDDLYNLLIADDDVEVIEHTESQSESVGPDGQQIQEPTHDVVIRVSKEEGEAKYCVLPPEEFLISRETTSVNPQKARFCEHRTRKTISELRDMGYDVADDISDTLSEDPTFSEQFTSRRQDESIAPSSNDLIDPSSREVIFREVFVDVDYDGDGIAELRKVCLVGREILSNEETEEKPFSAWTPYQQPFKFYGRCPADETIEIQRIKSTLWRQSLDNIYTINNNRVYVSDKVNLDDLVDNQIAGIVRIPGTQGIQNDIREATITPIGQVIQPMIEYLDSAKENRTGFTRYNQGTDSDSLNKTATGVRMISEAGNQRVEIISRAFAETALKPLMLGIHGLCRRHSTKEETVRLRGRWVTVDPRNWRTRYDMSVSVGLGSADKQMQMQGAQMLLNEQKALAAIPGLVTPENFFNAAAKLTTSLGEKNPDKFFSDPAKQPPQQPQGPSPEEQAAQQEGQQKQAETQIKGMQMAITAKQKDRELDIRERELAIKDRDSLVAADAKEAEIALAAQAQGIDMLAQLAQAVSGIQQTLHQMQTGHAELAARLDQQGFDQQRAMQQDDMARQGQEHNQSMAEQQLAQKTDGQA